MANECKDRDLLAIEPRIFTEGGFESQRLYVGDDGAISSTTFTSAQADFESTNILPGMVLCTYSTVPAEGRCYEIISVDSSTTMTVSNLRESESDPPIAPSTLTSQRYFIDTFAPQIAMVEASLNEKLRRYGEANGISPEEFADSSQLRKAVAFGVLSAVFTARASGAPDNDANWSKAEFYRQRHISAVGVLRMARDIDGDGYAEQTRTLSNVALRRD
jgi:hypothetical protein